MSLLLNKLGTGIVAVTLLVHSIEARVIRVPAEAPTIQAGFDSLADHDTLLVSIGEYAESLTAPALHFTLKGDVTPDTGDYARPVIDPSSLPGSDSLGCLFLPEGSVPVIEDIVFRNGAPMYPHWSQSVGGIRSYSGSVTLRNCVFDSTIVGFGHWRPNGEGIVDSLTNCVFRDVYLQGVYQLDYPVIASHCSFSGSSGYNLCVGGPGSRITACSFGSNSGGTGLLLDGNDTEVSDCTFGPALGARSLIINVPDSTLPAAHVHDNIFSGNELSDALINNWSNGADRFLIESNLFSQNQLTDSGTGIRQVSHSVFHPGWGGTIRNNSFVNCFGTSGAADVMSLDGDNTIFQNRFVEDETNLSQLAAVYNADSSQSTFRNNIFFHTGYALRSDAPSLDAEFNYWGDATGPYHETENPAGHGDTIVGNVDFTPWYPDTSFINEAHRISAPLPDHFTLAAYPNPFNSSMTLKLIPNAVMIIRVELFDILGRRVKELWSGPIAYEKQITFDGNNLASGIYFVRVWQPIGNRPLALQKIVLLK